MPRMSKKRRLEWSFFLNHRNRITYNDLCRGCTRGAVWKAVKALQENGYPISAVTNKGYSLDENTDILSLAGIKKYLDPDRQGLEIEVYKIGRAHV